MQLIRVRYYPATNHRGSHLIATNGQHKLSVPYQFGNDDQESSRQLNSSLQSLCPTLPSLTRYRASLMVTPTFVLFPSRLFELRTTV